MLATENFHNFDAEENNLIPVKIMFLIFKQKY